MRITEVDPNDDATFPEFYRVMRAANLYERPHAPIWTEHECQVMFGRPEPGESWTLYGAFDDEHGLVGGAVFCLPLKDNLDKAYFGVHVAPEHRRRGTGAAVLEHVEQQALAAGRTTLLAEANLPFERRDDHPYRRFAEKHGYAMASVEIRRELPLPVPDDTIQQWIDEAAPYHRDYRIETYVDDLPHELLESFCYLMNQLAVDAPTGDIDFEAEAVTPDDFLERRAKLKEMGRTVYETVAVDSSGEAVAHSTLSAKVDDPRGLVFQWGTLVHRDHRGHRLGLATKAANLQALQRGYPAGRTITTSNSETNANMVAINEKMGFLPVELMVEFQRKV